MLGDLVEFHKTVKRPQLAKILNYCYVRVPAPRNSPRDLLLEKTQRRKMFNKNLQEKKYLLHFGMPSLLQMKNSALYMVTSKYTRKFLIALYIEAHIYVTIHLGRQGLYKHILQKGKAERLRAKLETIPFAERMTEKEPSMPEMY